MEKTIQEAVAEKITQSGENVANTVIEKLAEVEISKRVDAITKAVQKQEQPAPAPGGSGDRPRPPLAKAPSGGWPADTWGNGPRQLPRWHHCPGPPPPPLGWAG